MKKLILLIAGILTSTLNFGQTNFRWEKTDSIKKTQLQIYADTKMFIAENWKSSKEVIQNDDKESGVILIKGKSIKKTTYMMGGYSFVYSYNVTFRMKENKYRITIDNVYCESAIMSNGTHFTKIDPFEGDDCPETGTFSKPGLPKSKVTPLMASFKEELQDIVDNYTDYMHRSREVLDNW